MIVLPRLAIALAALLVCASIATAEDMDVAVVARDRPFPISASVNATYELYCLRSSLLCTTLRDTLSRFAQEQRDVAWANGIESEIRSYVAAKAGFTIRTLECRRSLCVAEVAAVGGLFVAAFSPDRSLFRKLWPKFLAAGHETSESGEPITVTLLTYQRR
jgi:hypothetical protein